ncbi:hypothetical protein COOONC_12262 [Cooperia oncophora]
MPMNYNNNCILPTIQCFQIFLGFTATNCDLFIPKTPYVIAHLLLVYSIFTQVLLPGISEWLIYSIDAFDEAAFTFVAVPPKAFIGYNVFLITCFGLCLFGNVIMLSLVAYNKRPRLSLNTLSSKYQKRENIVTTRIAAVLTMLQMSIYMLYGSGIVVVRNMSQQWINDHYNLYHFLRSVAYVSLHEFGRAPFWKSSFLSSATTIAFDTISLSNPLLFMDFITNISCTACYSSFSQCIQRSRCLLDKLQTSL